MPGRPDPVLRGDPESVRHAVIRAHAAPGCKRRRQPLARDIERFGLAFRQPAWERAEGCPVLPSDWAGPRAEKIRPRAMRVQPSFACRAPAPYALRAAIRQPPERRSVTNSVSGASLGSSRVKMPWWSPSWLGPLNAGDASKTLAPKPERETLAVSVREWACGAHTLPQVSRSTARLSWRLARSALRSLLSAVISVLSSRSASAR